MAQLYARHHAAGRRLAATTSGPSDPDDLVNEAFEKVFGAIRRDAGPTEAFRAYLFVTIRRLAARHAAQQQDDPYDEVPESVAAVQQNPLDANERALVTEAFTALPERWQAVLWHTAVEGRNPREVADVLDMSANAVSALAYRAREKLRQSYLQAHLQAAPRPACEPHRSSLGAYVRDGLGKREQAATARHLESCPSCQALIQELNGVNQLLARAILPFFLVETVGEAVAAPAAAAAPSAAEALDLAADPAPVGPPEVLDAMDAAEVASSPARRLGALLPEGLTTGQLAGAGTATLALLVALGAGGSLLLEGEDPPSRPEVVTEDDTAETTGNAGPRVDETQETRDDGTESVIDELNELSTAEIAEDLDCFNSDEGDNASGADGDGGEGDDGDEDDAGDGSAEDDPGEDDTETGSGNLLDVEVSAGVSLGDALSVDEDGLPPEIQDVTCDNSSGENEFLVTIDSTIASTTTTATTEADSPDTVLEAEADVEVGAVTTVLPEAEVSAEASVNEELGVEAEVDTNLEELCDPDPGDDGNLICRIDEEQLNGAVSDTLSALGDAGVEIELGGGESSTTVQGGESTSTTAESGDGSTATVEIGDGGASVEANPLDLLP